MTDWYVIKILAPILLPLLFLGLLALLGALNAGLAESLSTAIANGQLAWASLGMSIGALYELRHFPNALPGSKMDDVAYWAVILVLLLQTVTAAVVPVAIQSRSQDSNERRILNRRRAIIASIALCIAAAVLYAAVHASRHTCLGGL